MKLKKFKAVISAVIIGVTGLLGSFATASAEDINTNMSNVIPESEIAITAGEDTPLNKNRIANPYRKITQYDEEFEPCVGGGIDAFAEYRSGEYQCGEYMDDVSFYADEFGIAIGFDYRYSESEKTLYIDDIYGVVRKLDVKNRLTDSSEMNKLWFPDTVDISASTSINSIGDQFFNFDNLMAEQFVGSNSNGFDKIVVSEEATATLKSTVVPIEKFFIDMGIKISLGYNYEGLVFRNGPERFSLFEGLPTSIKSIEVTPYGDNTGKYKVVNNMLIDTEKRKLICAAPGADFETTSYSDLNFSVPTETAVMINVGVDTVGMKAFNECDFSGKTLIFPTTKEIMFNALDFANAPDAIMFDSPKCVIRTPILGLGHEDTRIVAENNTPAELYADDYNLSFASIGVADVDFGDVNLDGNVTIADCVAISMYNLSNKSNSLSVFAEINADVQNDNIIDTSDSALLMNYVSMLIDYDKLGQIIK